MANLNDGLALDLDLFDNTKNGYVPVERKKKKIEAPKLIQSKPISFEQAQTEIKASRIAALRAGVIAIVALLILGSLIYSRVMLTNYQSELADQKAALKTEQSENVRLQMQFNSLMSMDKIEEYAQTKLGMVKRESYQVRYFDMSEDDNTETAQKDTNR
ncbi:septum formation initiator [Ruminococcus sp. CAG:563]|nr:septum formation initiator [Ruminococcus sp. CAG:563]HJI47459.1 septum formation initiator family protein [Oscillospiraceae bacterium]